MRELIDLGHVVRVATCTSERSPIDAIIPIVRNPSIGQLRRMLSWADICFQNHLSLRLLFPWFWTSTPLVVSANTWISLDGPLGWVKRMVLKRSHRFGVSTAIARHLPQPAGVLYNPLSAATDESIGKGDPRRDYDFLAVGRLVSDKGMDLFLRALASACLESGEAKGIRAAIVGDGPERKPLEKLSSELGIDQLIHFAGQCGREEVEAWYRRSKCLVVASTWEEPFGMIVLEALADGCGVIASDVGGLPEAVGDCGWLFSCRDVDSLARRM